MSQRTTLEELQAMSNDQLMDLWHKGGFPFEKLSCGTCLTEHASSRIKGWHDPDSCHHDELAQKVIAVHRFVGVPTKEALREHLAELLELRLCYNSLYSEVQP